MTEASQDVDVNVVNPSLPALPVRPELSSLSGARTSDYAEQALHVDFVQTLEVAGQATNVDFVQTCAIAEPALDVDEPETSNNTKQALHADVTKSSECAIAIVAATDRDSIKSESTVSDTDFSESIRADLNVTSFPSNTLASSNETSSYSSPEIPIISDTDPANVIVKGELSDRPIEGLVVCSSIQDSESNLSVSTDETLQNSDSDSFTRDTPSKANMGNQNSNKKRVQSDDDTPDEAKTKCCEIPKKKVKDRLSKVSRSSKSGEDFDFEDDELYPFEGRTKSELEIVDPVELEPFEIIETDDIKFIPGAGTSDVIKSASESKFKTIPEEDSYDGDEKYDTFIIKHDRTMEKERLNLEKGNRILESGTSTAHSTFEFKPAKSKQRVAKPKLEPEQSEPTYQNIQPVPEGSSGGSRKSSSSSSNEISRKNSKDGIKKPTRQKSKKRSDSSSDGKETDGKTDKAESGKLKSDSDKTEEPQEMSTSLVLTQTMFSVPNPKEKSEKAKLLNETKNTQQQYENVNVGVKFGPTGITICNTPPDSLTKKSKNNSDKTISDASKSVDNNAIAKTPVSSETPIETPVYETLTSPTQEQTKPKSLTTADNKSPAGKGDPISPEQVPPPSPLAMEILEEEEEDENDEEEEVNENELINEINRRKSEIMEFTENVCKRLSQLLDDQNELRIVEDGDNYQQEQIEHIYETVRKDDQMCEPKSTAGDYVSMDEFLKMEESFTRPPKREDSSSTLKRTSGDSANYTVMEAAGSSDDDLPEYFDPKSVQPKRDSEILCDVLDAYSEETIPTVSAKDVADIVDSLTLNFGENVQGHSTNKSDKNLALPLNEFNLNLVNTSSAINTVDDLQEKTPIADIQPELKALPELANVTEDVPIQYDPSGRQSVTQTESDLDISEHRDDRSSDSMLADDEDEETMEILFTKTYTEPRDGGEVFLSCTVVNSAYKEEQKKSETWLSDEALEYFEANAADVMSTAFMKAKKEMKDIQICLQSLRKQMEHFHDDVDDISLPDIPVDALSPTDYFGLPRKAVTD